jgi:LysR family transcriptional regulator for bpeEF and oprC
VNNSFAARDAALLGIGICQLPWLIATESIQMGTLTQILPEWAIPEVPINAIYPSHNA